MKTRKWLWGGLAVALLGVGLLAGCIQPVSNADLTQTALAPYAAFPTATSALPDGSRTEATPAPDALAGQFIASRGQTPASLQIWYDQPHQPDRLQGFSYTGAGGVPCAGYLLVAQVGGAWQPNNGALVCAGSPETEALAAVTFFLTSDQQPYTIVFGRLLDPSVTAIAVQFNDGTSQQTTPQAGGFLLVRPGVAGANVITAINAEGNTVFPNIPQSPV
ncbi:MAG: hypothetical protein KBH93_03425 [Anaerolineae bacterium]|nr:hypothetical protein [Anaerolineae bacterium]